MTRSPITIFTHRSFSEDSAPHTPRAPRAPHAATRAPRAVTRTLAIALTLATGASLAACKPGEDNTAATTTAEAAATSTGVAADGLPVNARPEGTKGDTTPVCPYFNTQELADMNGQRVTGVNVDTRFNPPSCQWWSYQDVPQAQIIVRTATNEQAAIDMVGEAVTHPGTTDEVGTITRGADGTISGGSVDQATVPSGWQGYRAHTDGYAVYAVRKGTQVVIVHSNQAQTVKVQKIAEKVIANLGI